MKARQGGADADLRAAGRGGPSAPAALAFFDVDETLVADKTIFSFLRHHYRNTVAYPATAAHADADYARAQAELRALAAAGLPRAEVNRAYYRLFAGRTKAELAKSGTTWFAERLATGSFFHPPVLAALRAHEAAGETVVLLSGSFFACLHPIARHVHATEVIGTTLLTSGDQLTGEIEQPMIGPAKAEAAAKLAAARGVALAECSAYGDHVSDLALLQAVGHPVAVGEDAALGAYVDAVGGRRLPGVVSG